MPTPEDNLGGERHTVRPLANKTRPDDDSSSATSGSHRMHCGQLTTSPPPICREYVPSAVTETCTSNPLGLTLLRFDCATLFCTVMLD